MLTVLNKVGEPQCNGGMERLGVRPLAGTGVDDNVKYDQSDGGIATGEIREGTSSPVRIGKRKRRTMKEIEGRKEFLKGIGPGKDNG